MPDKINLPTTTFQIFDCAMSNTVSPSEKFTVNFEDLNSLAQINEFAFYNSQVGGDLVFNSSRLTFVSYVFYNCKNIETFDASMVYNSDYGRDVFSGCTDLRTADLGYFAYYAQLYGGLFNYCENLTDLTIGSFSAPGLIIDGTMGFQFDYSITSEEEMDRLKVHVQLGREEAYISKWCYGYMGYFDGIRKGSSYLNLWEDIQLENMVYNESTGEYEYPADEEVDRLVKERVLEKENQMRKMFGLDTVDEPSNFYPYRVDGDGYITLIGVPSDTKYLTLDQYNEEIGLPNGWCIDYIGKGAFSGANELEDLYIMDCIVGINSNAFEGYEGDGVNIYLSGNKIPELLVNSSDEKFSFGCDESKIHLVVDSMWTFYKPEDFIASWVYRFAGYENFVQMKGKVVNDLSAKNGVVPTDEEVQEEMRRILLPYENRLRAMMGVDSVTEDDETSVVNILIANNGEYEYNKEPDYTDPDFPEWPDLPDLPDLPDIPETPDTGENGETGDIENPDNGNTGDTENPSNGDNGNTGDTDNSDSGDNGNTGDTDNSDNGDNGNTGDTDNSDSDDNGNTGDAENPSDGDNADSSNDGDSENGSSEDNNSDNGSTDDSLSDSSDSGEGEEIN